MTEAGSHNAHPSTHATEAASASLPAKDDVRSGTASVTPALAVPDARHLSDGRAVETPIVGHDALALIELTSIARGYRVADEMLKKAPIQLLDVGVVSPGKYLIVVSGDVASVEEAFLQGLSVGGEWVLDKLLLPQPHADLLVALRQQLPPVNIDAMGIVETFSVISTVAAADVALKAAAVSMLELHYLKHMGGKGYFALTGEQYDVEAALDAAVNRLRGSGALLKHELIARPHDEFKARLYPNCR